MTFTSTVTWFRHRFTPRGRRESQAERLAHQRARAGQSQRIAKERGTAEHKAGYYGL